MAIGASDESSEIHVGDGGLIDNVPIALQGGVEITRFLQTSTLIKPTVETNKFIFVLLVEFGERVSGGCQVFLPGFGSRWVGPRFLEIKLC